MRQKRSKGSLTMKTIRPWLPQIAFGIIVSAISVPMLFWVWSVIEGDNAAREAGWPIWPAYLIFGAAIAGVVFLSCFTIWCGRPRRTEEIAKVER